MENTTKKLKEIAQDEILHAVIHAIYSVNDHSGLSQKEKDFVIRTISKEMAHLEKRYGYNQYSWARG